MLNPKTNTTILVIVIFVLAMQTADAFKMPRLDLDNSLEKVIKGAGIIFLIKQFGGELNNFINKVLSDKSVPNVEATKVVPILTFGQGIEAGACQIAGPANKVGQVEAGFSVAAMLDKGHRFNIQTLVPSSSLNPLKLNRVYGVGITAIIDYKL